MIGVFRTVLLMGMLAVAPVWAESDEVPVQEQGSVAEESAQAVAEDEGLVDVSVTGEQVVTVNTGNEQVDAAANLIARCAERKAAHTACGSGFKAIACKKSVDLTRYRGLDCPDL
ncbi:MAG: hypothetical protein V2I38_14620 [Alcanivoracaceae bacterium]|jgi:hypothetical protein|nr:hypothetical protein [Alcanivoracaceae bacterium]